MPRGAYELMGRRKIGDAMDYATAKDIETGYIPVIDIGPLRDGSDPRRVAEEIHRASREVGFLYISNHGISETLIDEARHAALEFFHLPERQKLRVEVSAKHRGFLKVGDAKMQDDVLPDLKESFIWGYEGPDGQTLDDHPLRGPNRWPAPLPGLRTTARSYFDAAQDVARHLMRAAALGLNLPEEFFLRGHVRPLSRASMIYYPPQPPRMGEDQFGAGPHTDFGVLTVLCQDAVGGLQVQDLAGEWVAAPPLEGTLVVNVGDLLARWTNDQYRSTPHRVVNTSGRERISLVLAYDPDYPTLIDPREVCGDDANVDYDPISCGDYLIWRFDKAFGYRKRI